MKLNKIKINLIPVTILLILLSVISTAQSQKKNIQIQIGGQIMQNYNLGGLISNGWGYGGYQETSQSVASTFNQDLSLTYSFNKHHAAILGGGLYTTCRWVDACTTTDTGGKDYYIAKQCYENYSMYLLYQHKFMLSQKWNLNGALGPMWAKNHNQADWFFVPVKFNYFSCIGKLGFQYLINDHFTFDLNGMAVRSLTNILDQNQASEGSIIPFLIGLDFRIGYQF
jgi:hypothetical protein